MIPQAKAGDCESCTVPTGFGGNGRCSCLCHYKYHEPLPYLNLFSNKITITIIANIMNHFHISFFFIFVSYCPIELPPSLH